MRSGISNLVAAMRVTSLADAHPPAPWVLRLGERLAAERLSCEATAALLGRCRPGEVEHTLLSRIHQDEARHYQCAAGLLDELGVDRANILESAAGGLAGKLLGFIGNGANSMEACLHALIMSELPSDGDWRMLVQLAETFGRCDLAWMFTEAQADEKRHVASIRRWLMVVGEWNAEQAPSLPAASLPGTPAPSGGE